MMISSKLTTDLYSYEVIRTCAEMSKGPSGNNLNSIFFHLFMKEIYFYSII